MTRADGKPRRILIALDPQPDEARDALALGRMLAEAARMEPIVARIRREPEWLAARGGLNDASEADASGALELARGVFGSRELPARELGRPSVAQGLQELAMAEDAGLIVLGSSQRAEAGSTHVGAVGHGLLHGSPCAVSVAPRAYAKRAERAVSRIAVALDESPESDAALAEAVALARASKAHLDLLSAAEPGHFGAATALSILTEAEFHDFEQEAKRRVLDRALERVLADTEVSARLLTGEPGRALREASEGYDLMVVGSRRYGPVRRVLLGSTTRDLLEGARCPVLVVPRGAGAGQGPSPEAGQAHAY